MGTTTQAANLVAIEGSRGDVLLYTGGALTLAAVRPFVGSRVTMHTGHANEVAVYTIESITQNRETGDIVAWVTRPGLTGGSHKDIVAKRADA